jgi:hypothetical protein
MRRSLATIAVALLLAACSGSQGAMPTSPSGTLPPPPLGGSLTGGLLVFVPAGLFPGESDNAIAHVNSTKDGITISEPTTLATWVSSNPSVATVTVAGRVTAVAAGTSVLTATYEGKSASATLVVSNVSDIASIEVLCASPVRVGERSLCFANARLANGAPSRPTFEWSSSRPDVLAVEAGGMLTGRSVGDATITASYRGRQGTARVPVIE